MEVTVKQRVSLGGSIYEYFGLYLIRTFEVPFLPQKGMLIDITPYIYPQIINRVAWYTKDNSVEVWIEDRVFGENIKKKNMLDVFKAFKEHLDFMYNSTWTFSDGYKLAEIGKSEADFDVDDYKKMFGIKDK